MGLELAVRLPEILSTSCTLTLINFNIIVGLIRNLNRKNYLHKRISHFRDNSPIR
jgi:hypothetical protein